MPAKIIDETNITPSQDAAIRALLCLAFPQDVATFSKTRAWNNSAPAFTSLIEETNPIGGGVNHIIAHIGVVDRTIRIQSIQASSLKPQDSIPLRVAGIQNVAVHPDHRGKGLTDQTMQLAMTEAKSRNFDLGLLFCLPQLEKLYARLGWKILPETPVTRIHEGKDTALPGKNIAMFFPLAKPHFPPRPIHLNGDDW